MDEGLTKWICERFAVSKPDAQTYSPLALAYIGDGVFDLVIRTLVVCEGNTSADKLHRRTSRIVNAASQAKLADAVMEELTDEEKAVFKRGRNAKSHSTAKNASVHDYRVATGLEALMGYLYLEGRMDRLLELIRFGLSGSDSGG